MQDLPVVPGQRVPRDEDVLRHHRLWGGKEPAPWGSIQSQTENKTREMLVSRVACKAAFAFLAQTSPVPYKRHIVASARPMQFSSGPNMHIPLDKIKTCS